MKIEEGRYYRTRNGIKVGPMKPNTNFVSEWGEWTCDLNPPQIFGPYWFRDGSFWSNQTSAEDLVAEWFEEPKKWREMTDAEKGALLLAAHRGEVIEMWNQRGEWMKSVEFGACDDIAYRVRPEPKRETATLYGAGSLWSFIRRGDDATHRITFDLIDGEPDPSSIKMERL